MGTGGNTGLVPGHWCEIESPSISERDGLPFFEEVCLFDALLMSLNQAFREHTVCDRLTEDVRILFNLF